MTDLLLMKQQDAKKNRILKISSLKLKTET